MKYQQFVNQLAPAKVIQSRLHKHVMLQFADKLGMVYFGYVDQRNDDHRLVRGLTVSPTHRDNHYCIGSYDGYDITLVERADTVTFPAKPSRNYRWIIMVFDLHAKVDLPHIFMGLHTLSETFYARLFTRFSQLSKVPLGRLGTYEGTFAQRYALYAPPAEAISAERLFRPEVAKAIVDHFGSTTLEIADGCLYLYSEQSPNEAMLEKMLSNGIWLAKLLDKDLDDA